MPIEVSQVQAVARPTVVVLATTTWREFPALWPALLGEVWECLRAAGVTGGCRNVMLYRDDGPDGPDVEVGVLLDRPIPLSGRVTTSTLPAGPAAVAVHHGPFGELGATHEAVADWCAGQGLRRSGTRWEVYGPHDEDPARQWVEVGWLLDDPPA